jgi:equilibrative nucleoside transporter 1/2/3
MLTLSTVFFIDVSTNAYLGFLLVNVAAAGWATGLMQNGAFAFAASFGRPEYMQAVMTGQGVAGVLPPFVQLISVLIFPSKDQDEGSTRDAPEGQASAFLYFLAAVAISVATFVAFIPLVRRHNAMMEDRRAEQMADSMAGIEEAERAARKTISLWRLFKKLHWLCIAVALTFAATMFYPVFSAKITSVNWQPGAGAIFQPAAFIPFALLFWNLGDFSGRVATILPFSLSKRPFLLFVLSVLRMGILPLYLLCNIGGRGAIVNSDFFYLVVVQLLFGLSNGWVSSSCMIAAGEWVEDGEREAAGSFMGLCLVFGLTMGSVLSFTIAEI